MEKIRHKLLKIISLFLIIAMGTVSVQSLCHLILNIVKQRHMYKNMAD